jgi:hypothetical protein
VIEIQSTFYDPPALNVAARWRALAPPEFDFCIKASTSHRLIIAPTCRRPAVGTKRHTIDSFRMAF